MPSSLACYVAICVLLWTARAKADDNADATAAPDATVSLTNFQAATTEIGQPDLSHNDDNQGGATAANTISDPYGSPSISSNGVLYLPDSANSRVLGFLAFPSSNDASADFALGQPNLSSNGFGNAANQFTGPQTTIAYKKMLLVDEFANNRVLIWNKAPTSNQAPANLVVGKAGFGSDVAACSAAGMHDPETAAVGGGKLLVADSENNRVLIRKKIPKSNGRPANIVLGQTNFTTCVKDNNGSGVGGGPNASNMIYPGGIWTNGKRLVISDGNNNRVLIWNKFPKRNFQPADIVLGQPDFTSNAKDNDGTGASGAPSASNMEFPYIGVYSNGTQLFVSDYSNNRVLMWNHFPTHNFAPADVVLGQPTTDWLG